MKEKFHHQKSTILNVCISNTGTANFIYKKLENPISLKTTHQCQKIDNECLQFSILNTIQVNWK